jgi:uncharacterized iron-regulated protein
MKKALILTLCGMLNIYVFAQKPSHIIYNSKGEKVAYQEMLKSLSKEDVVLFGELHDNPIAHWLQLELTRDLDSFRNLMLGAEMIEADNQNALNLYLNDSIDKKGLDTMARLWINHKTDYAPLLRYAKDSGIGFIATNVPRRFAKKVYSSGFGALDSLSDREKDWVAPLPILFDSLLPKYQNILKMMGGHGSPNLVKAQALKDATMAYFILKNHENGQLFLHYNGAYHSDHYEGILWYLKKANENLNYSTISTVSQEDISSLEEENLNRADFIICVDSDMTSTH